jgi:Ran GTPase-activating protein (RanGAP) involved in mRNA processing and transport
VLALDERRVGLQSKLKVLDLSKNNLQKDGVKTLAGVLPYNNVLEFLDLSKTNMGVSGADEIAKSLRNNKSLKYLNFFNNKIGYDGAKSIAENVIAHHPTLEFLEIGHNRIRDKGLTSIVTALLLNSKSNIKVLGLRFNFLTNEGIL